MKELFRNIAKWFVILCIFIKTALTVRYELTSLHILAIGFFYTPIVKLANLAAPYPSTAHFMIWLCCFMVVFAVVDKLTGIKRTLKAE
jgi:hypothetical protein